MVQLQTLLEGLDVIDFVGNVQREINSIHFDSRRVTKSDVFFAVKGSSLDGHMYIDMAIGRGASTIICQTLPKSITENITYIIVNNSSYALGLVAANYFGNPSKRICLIGVTGTNGKTSTVSLCHQLFRQLGYKVGLLSTINIKINEEVLPSTHTTPDAIQLNELLCKMVDAGCKYCFMEVSSHSIHQNRIAGLEFTGAVFTNITHDHLDYHNTFEEYLKVKKSFIDNLSAKSFVVTNTDDPNGDFIVKDSRAKVHTLSIKNNANFTSRIISSDLRGLLIELGNKPVQLKLLGAYNVYNSLSVFAIAACLGVVKSLIIDSFPTLEPIEGRFNPIKHKNIIGIIDYAHTPDALENILQNIRELNPNKIITVFGCGGDRDSSKRPIMGEIAKRLSDTIYLTSDNPRSENPMKIIKDIYPMLPSIEDENVHFNIDREQSIKDAVELSKGGDVILVAGKGHETYQEINGIKHPFNDLEILKKYLLQK